MNIIALILAFLFAILSIVGGYYLIQLVGVPIALLLMLVGLLFAAVIVSFARKK